MGSVSTTSLACENLDWGRYAAMAREADYYTVDEAARILGMSPARVRQTLRSGELEGERREERIEGVFGPWRIPAHAVRDFQGRLKVEGGETTVALSPGEEATADTLSATRNQRPQR